MKLTSFLAAIACIASASTLIAGHDLTIVQKNRSFSEEAVMIQRGDTLRFTNEDGFPHQIYVQSPRFSFDSDPQKPGSTVEFSIPEPGLYRVLCGIHPKMRLDVEVR